MSSNNKTYLRYYFLLPVLPLLLAVGSASAQQQFAHAARFTVHGRVLTTDDQPVQGAIIRIPDAHQLGVSDSLGNFTIDYMLPGVYEVEVTGDDFIEIKGRMDIEPDHFMLARVQSQPVTSISQVALDMLKVRRDKTAYTAKTYNRDQLKDQPGTMRDLLLDSGNKLLLCGRMGGGADPECTYHAGDATAIRIFIDEIQNPTMPLTQILPRDFAYVEYYPSLAMLRLYSARFLRRLPTLGATLEVIHE